MMIMVMMERWKCACSFEEDLPLCQMYIGLHGSLAAVKKTGTNILGIHLDSKED